MVDLLELIPELEAEETALGEALPDVGRSTAFIVVIGLIGIASAFVQALFGIAEGALGWVPWLGSKVTAPLQSIEQRLINALGAVEANIDQEMGRSFHTMARLVHQIPQDIAVGAVVLYHLAARGTTHTVKVVEHTLRIKTVTEVATGASQIAQEALNHADTAARSAEHAEGVLRHEIASVAADVEGAIVPSVKALQAATIKLEKGLADSWELLQKHEEAIGIGAITAATAIALDELGIGQLRCASNRTFSKGLCEAGPQTIQNLLGLLFAGAAIADFRTLVKLAQSVEHVTAEGITELLRV